MMREIKKKSFGFTTFMRTERGFTLIELLLVVSIVLIIGTFSAVFYTRFLTQNAVANTQDQLMGQLRKAQIYSMMGKQNGIWGVKYSSITKKITLYLTGNSAFDENFTTNNNIIISNFSDLSFARITGSPTSGTYPLTITITGNDSIRQVTVNSQGVVSR